MKTETFYNIQQNSRIIFLVLFFSSIVCDITMAYNAGLVSAPQRHLATGFRNLQSPISNWNLLPTTQNKIGDQGHCHNQNLDLVFLLDGSRSVGERNFQKILNFTAEMASKFELGQTRVGVVQFSSCIRPYIFLKDQYNDHALLRNAILRIKYDAKGTATGRALRFTATKMFSRKKGGRDLRTGVRRVVIMVTDGQWASKSDVIDAVELLEEKSVERFAIGIGKTVKTVDLSIVTSQATDFHQYYIENYEKLVATGEKFLKLICIRNETCINGNLVGQDFKGFDLVRLMNVEASLNNQQHTTYNVGPQTDLTIDPTSQIFQTQFPTHFAIVATFRMNDETTDMNWILFEIQQPSVGAIFSIRIQGKRDRQIEYLVQNEKGEIETFEITAGVDKLFEEGFHKLVLYVSPRHTYLTLDCALIGQIQHATPPYLIDTSGRIIVAKNDNQDSVLLDFKEMLIVCGATYEKDSRKFNCSNTNMEVESKQLQPTRQAQQLREPEVIRHLPNTYVTDVDDVVQPHIITTSTNHNAYTTPRDVQPTSQPPNGASQNNFPTYNAGVIPNFIGLGKKLDECQPGPRGYPGIMGPKGHHGDTGWPGYEGKQGPQGPLGAVGAVGRRGEKGERGWKGEQGYTGEKGDHGPKGAHGPPGVPGSNGARGIAGRPGIPGARGGQGVAGQKGEEGGIGPEGIKGQQGERGVAGVSGGRNGRPGRRGEKGDAGETGSIGLKGDRGPKGYPGLNGDVGDQGKPGEKGSEGRKGNQGYDGPTGRPGAVGLPGSVGRKGDKGDNGSKGTNGPRGHQGEIGVKGSSGKPGYPGNPGFPGNPGYKGHEGKEGETGKQGERGLQGPPGPIGPKGNKGEQGDIGRRGENGIQGKPGPIGVKGMTGPHGKEGKAGSMGPKGDQGPIGRSGYPGGRGPPRSMKEIEEFVKAKLAEMLPKYIDSVKQECQKCTTVRGYQVPGPPGPMGPKGSMGLPGNHGDMGLKGSRGPRGDKGEMGVVGSRGDKGDVGPRGYSIPGPQGGVGPRGIKGNKGASKHGIDGRKGGHGVEGSRGKMGVQGRQGRPGACDITICNPQAAYQNPFSYNKGPSPQDGAREQQLRNRFQGPRTRYRK